MKARKTESSLQRLRQGAQRRVGASTDASDNIISDTDKICMQLFLDIQEYARNLHAIGIDAREIDSYRALWQCVAPKDKQENIQRTFMLKYLCSRPGCRAGWSARCSRGHAGRRASGGEHPRRHTRLWDSAEDAYNQEADGAWRRPRWRKIEWPVSHTVRARQWPAAPGHGRRPDLPAGGDDEEDRCRRTSGKEATALRTPTTRRPTAPAVTREARETEALGGARMSCRHRPQSRSSGRRR